MTTEDINDTLDYLTVRLDDQLDYFNSNAILNQKKYKFFKSLSVVCSVLTTIIVAVVFVVPEAIKNYIGICALVSSAIVLFTYQWEEFQNYGAKWEKFRLVAEQLKSEKYLFLADSGHYSDLDPREKKCLLARTVEQIIRGTDISYFSMMVEPGKRIEKRLEGFRQE